MAVPRAGSYSLSNNTANHGTGIEVFLVQWRYRVPVPIRSIIGPATGGRPGFGPLAL
jgi:hypothetical protein